MDPDDRKQTDWSEWHSRYADPTSETSRRLKIVQSFITRWLDETAPRSVRVLSVCAGDGRDILQVLGARTDAASVTATLIEANGENVTRARQQVEEFALRDVQVVEADASHTAAYRDVGPADLVLIAGVFGNIRDLDVRAVITWLPEICARGATVIWTRRRRPRGIIGLICDWFEDEGFERLRWPVEDETLAFVGAHRFTGDPRSRGDDRRIFKFEK